MGLLDNFEQRLDQLVNGSFAKAFRDAVEPVELASRIQKEMDTRSAVVSKGRTVVPNVFAIELAPSDLERLDIYDEQMRAELAEVVRQYAAEQRYTFLGPVEVSFSEDPTLETGIFTVRSQAQRDNRPSGPPPAPISPVQTTGHPRLVIGAQSYPLTRGRIRIGRGSGADIRIDDPGISRAHADILLGMPVVIRDLGSTNGTLLEGRKVSEAPLYDGARIQLGSTVATYREV
ncbi:MAG: DUF3662 and FHA domain-containing protein [Actinomycetia bacterium]|nr:DUF3662 and FHA domain-containing protein [Actinomycetes bacterium]